MPNLQPSRTNTLEGTARVVRVEGNVVWLEPEQGGSCGGCASAGSCSSRGIGPLASRIEQRRFPLENVTGLAPGECVVVGIQEAALVNGALLAYGVPLMTMFAAAGVAQWLAVAEAMVPVAAAAGLAAGLGLTHLGARHLAAAGAISPQHLRRVDGACAAGEDGTRP